MAPVSVIVPARNAAATLPRTLEALSRQTRAGEFEVVVVDNGSSDGTAEAARGAPLDVVLVQRPAGGTSSDARNSGIDAASGGLLAFTDADCFPEPGWLEAGIAALAGADLVVGRVAPDPRAAMGPFDRSLWVERDSGLYETANLFARRELLERAGRFEHLIDDSGRPFGEDVWLGRRMRRAGARTAFCEAALVHHAVLPRGPREYVAERRRLRHFPALAAHIPELRDEMFFARVFLSPRTAAFDAALAGAALAAAARSPLPLAAAAPYGVLLARRSLRWRRRAPLVAAVETAAGAVGLASLAYGSLRERSPVL